MGTRYEVVMAGLQGLEPWLAEPESAVLPIERQPIAKMEPTENRISCQQKNRKNFKASYPAEKMREWTGGKSRLAQSQEAALQNISHDI